MFSIFLKGFLRRAFRRLIFSLVLERFTYLAKSKAKKMQNLITSPDRQVTRFDTHSQKHQIDEEPSGENVQPIALSL